MKYVKVKLEEFNDVMRALRTGAATKTNMRNISEVLQDGASNNDERDLISASGRLIERLSPVIDIIAYIEDDKEAFKEKYGKDRYNDITEFASHIKALINKLV